MRKTLLLIFHSTSLWFLAGICYHTPNPNPQNQVVVPELLVLLADAHSSGGGTSKANSNQGHSYCSLEPPRCHKAGILSPFICFHSPDKSEACGGFPQMCACPIACRATRISLFQSREPASLCSSCLHEVLQTRELDWSHRVQIILNYRFCSKL